MSSFENLRVVDNFYQTSMQCYCVVETLPTQRRTF